MSGSWPTPDRFRQDSDERSWDNRDTAGHLMSVRLQG